MSTPGVDDQTAGEADQRFHLAIARISGNPVVEYCIHLIWRMRNELPRVQKVYTRVCHDDGSNRANEHDAILAALRAHSPAEARRAMQDHFRRLFEAMLEATESDALDEIRRRTQQHRERFLATTHI